MKISTRRESAAIVLSIGAALWLSPGSLRAQSCLPEGTGVPKEPRLEEACQASVRAVVDPSLTSVTRRTELQAQISATRKDESAAIEFRIGNDKGSPQDRSSFQHKLKLSGPIGKDDTETDLATLEGLQANTKLSYGLSWRSVDPKNVLLSKDTDEWNALLCAALKQDGKLDKAKDCDDAAERDGLFFEHLTYGSEAYKKLLRDLGLANGSVLVGLEATYAAPKKFEFVTTDSLEVQSVEHDGFAASLGIGWLPYRKSFYYLGFAYRYEEGFKSQEEQEICQPFGEGLGALSCGKSAVGAPAESTKQIGSLELQKYFRNGSLAFNPRFSRDLENNVSSVRLPVYFLKDGQGNLNGGIAAGWRSDTDDYTLSLFVGSMNNPFK